MFEESLIEWLGGVAILAGLLALARIAWPHRRSALGSSVMLMVVSFGAFQGRDIVEYLARVTWILSGLEEAERISEAVYLLWPAGEASLMVFGVAWLYFSQAVTSDDQYRPSRRFAIALWALAAIEIALMLSQLAWYAPVRAEEWGPILDAAYLAAWLVLGLMVVVGLAKFLRTYLFTRAIATRRGMKWIMSCMIFALLVATVAMGPELLHQPGLIASDGIEHLPILIVVGCVLYTLRRYNALDIDLVVSRILIYTGLTVTMVGVYWLSMVALERMGYEIGHGIHHLLVFGLGIAATLIMLPLRAVIQKVVDRLLDHDRYDYNGTLLALSEELSHSLDLQSVLDRVLDAVVRMVRCESAWVMLLDEKRRSYVVRAWRGNEPDGFDLAIPIEAVRIDKTGATVAWPGDEGQSMALAAESTAPAPSVAERGPSTTKASLVLPLVKNGVTLGLLCVGGKRWGEVYVQRDLSLLHTISNHAALAVSNAELYARLERLNEELRERVHEQTEKLQRANQLLRRLHEEAEREANTDALTGLYNRRFLEVKLAEELAKAQRCNDSLSVIFLDVDGLKTVNDTYGHLHGDQVLKDVALAIGEVIRSSDLAFRFGGDEFVILLPGTTKERAQVIVARLEERPSGQARDGKGEAEPIASVSIGFATFPEDARSAWELIDAADHASYREKRQGRGRRAASDADQQPAQGAALAAQSLVHL